MTDYQKNILRAFVQASDNERWSSQDICDLLQDTITLTPDEVTEFMMENGWVPWRKDDGIVWHKFNE